MCCPNIGNNKRSVQQNEEEKYERQEIQAIVLKIQT